MDIEKLVNRFLAWPLPASVRCDDIATVYNAKHRTGTNLLTFDEARQMLEYLLSPGGIPSETPDPSAKSRGGVRLCQKHGGMAPMQDCDVCMIGPAPVFEEQVPAFWWEPLHTLRPYVGWMIERGGAPAEYWVSGGLRDGGGYTEKWTTDPQRGVKLSNQSLALAEAEKLLHLGIQGPLRVCDHMFNCDTGCRAATPAGIRCQLQDGHAGLHQFIEEFVELKNAAAQASDVATADSAVSGEARIPERSPTRAHSGAPASAAPMPDEPRPVEVMRGFLAESIAVSKNGNTSQIIGYIDALLARLAECEMDAARYRWLREMPLNSAIVVIVDDDRADDVDCIEKAELDEIVDTGIEANGLVIKL